MLSLWNRLNPRARSMLTWFGLGFCEEGAQHVGTTFNLRDIRRIVHPLSDKKGTCRYVILSLRDIRRIVHPLPKKGTCRDIISHSRYGTLVTSRRQ